MLVPSGVEHATSFPSRMRGAALWIDREVFAEIADAVGCVHGPSTGLIPDARSLARLGAVLAVEAKQRDRGALLAADAIAEAMIAIALRGAPLANDGPRPPSFSRRHRALSVSLSHGGSSRARRRASAPRSLWRHRGRALGRSLRPEPLRANVPPALRHLAGPLGGDGARPRPPRAPGARDVRLGAACHARQLERSVRLT